MRHGKNTVRIIASTGLLQGGLNAQQETPIYLTVACVNAAPGKSAEYRQFVSDTSKKIAEVRLKAGEIVSWSFSRSIMPAGDEARCDYTIATASEGVPARNNDTAALAKAIDQADLKMSASQYLAKRDSLSHLVAMEMWASRVRVGHLEKGNYFFVNHMRVHNNAEYVKFETEVWRPIAEEWIKEGSQKGWRFNTLLLPSGTEAKYTALSVDIYPTWESVFKRRSLQDTFKKVHAGKDYDQVVGGMGKLRDLAHRDLMYAEEVVAKK
jgi:hypothetical protein